MTDPIRSYLNIDEQSPLFPTHLHTGEFWEGLGRAVATYGFLEKVLGRAIYALTATTVVAEADIAEAVAKWEKILESCLKDPLGGLIPKFEGALKNHDQGIDSSEIELVTLLRNAKKLRDLLCHASWFPPDDLDKALPWFVNRDLEIPETSVDVKFLANTQTHVAELACAVISSVTGRGIQFPGSNGPGKPLRRSSN